MFEVIFGAYYEVYYLTYCICFLGSTDCGMFMVKFIEFLMTKDLDIRDCVQAKMDIFRYNSCVQLFTHGCRKRAGIYVSDDE